MEATIIQKAVDWVKNKRYKQIRSEFEEFESPAIYYRKSDELEMVPHFTGKKVRGKDYIDIGIKSDNVKRKVSRWTLFSTLASLKNGKLYLLVPRGNKAFTQRLVDKHSIKAELVSI